MVSAHDISKKLKSNLKKKKTNKNKTPIFYMDSQQSKRNFESITIIESIKLTII